MTNQQDILEARRAIASALSKSEKALSKLTEGTWQHGMAADGIAAYRIAIALIDGEPASASNGEMSAAIAFFTAAKARVEKTLPKFASGTSQHTIAIRRIAAFEIAMELIEASIHEM